MKATLSRIAFLCFGSVAASLLTCPAQAVPQPVYLDSSTLMGFKFDKLPAFGASTYQPLVAVIGALVPPHTPIEFVIPVETSSLCEPRNGQDACLADLGLLLQTVQRGLLTYVDHVCMQRFMIAMVDPERPSSFKQLPTAVGLRAETRVVPCPKTP